MEKVNEALSANENGRTIDDLSNILKFAKLLDVKPALIEQTGCEH